ncbi:hypothetical protein BDY19DRAFT_651560 [Irpex rosettiformis]|uniref:Uncharacterized protein n=1 Tax=Irpex rosettiformis TaxID=378272 RepID=A0ACB8TNI2_9APHY|nr:hypothetical protein BDY19DRAFT_651560 [Irpex rosettiformis]
MPQLWALLVAIENYLSPTWPPVADALADSQNVFRYLTSDMGIPEDHILCLNNANATRAGIISAFREHLVDNPRISKGDAILFYYSGHGSYIKSPEGWTTVKLPGGDSNDMVEGILPYDEGFKYPHANTPTYPIPDRTLAALVDLAAASHGDNITIALECSPNGSTANANPEYPSPLPPTLDHGLVSLVSSSRKPNARRNVRQGRFPALRTDYVLLAACKLGEKAHRVNGRGGLFTTLWLCAMRADLRPRTYAGVIKHTNSQQIRMKEIGSVMFDQHPQCEGDVRGRIVFEETMIKRDHFDATLKSPDGEFEVEAGEVHGVKEGTGFDIYGLDKFLQGTKLGTANAVRVGGTTCTVRADWEVPPPDAFAAYSATIIQKPALKYIIRRDPQTSDPVDANATIRTLSKALIKERHINEVTDADDADLEVRIGIRGSIALHRQDSLIRHLLNPIPQIARSGLEVENLNRIFCGIARFNFHLTLTNQKHPFAEKITFEMLRFSRTDDVTADRKVFPLRKVYGFDPSTDDNTGFEVTDQDDYAIVLCNDSDVDLYVQIWYFDPDEYSVATLYEPPSDAQPSLPRNGGVLQIGKSAEIPWALTYYVPIGGTASTLFMKVFLTDKPVKLRAMQQPVLVGPGATDDRGLQQGEPETKGLWDTILQPVTVVRAKD